MKLKLLATLIVAFITVGTYAQKKRNMTSGKTLVAYFSATGNTAKAARKIAASTGGTLYAIQPIQKYTTADLNWNDKNSRSTKEMNDAKSRPGIKKTLKDIQQYDTVYIGFPIWWDLAPRVINTFIESYNLTGKTIIPFATSGGSGIDNSEKQLKKSYPKLKWKPGKLMN